MKEFLATAMLVFFTVGLIITFVFKPGGFKEDAANVQVKTHAMIENAQSSMDGAGLGDTVVSK